MKRLLLIVISFVQVQLYAQVYWQQEVNYTINVILNDKDKTLDAFQKITYVNHSPDTLTYIWFHLWPNAYKNDQTAYSKQAVLNGDTRFYFSSEEERGYINRLDFKVNDITATTTDHPEHIDITRLNLPTALLPGQSITITTPFHVKLPKNYSRGGFAGETFQATQWYPKPAVYDRTGWHPMPYLDQGEFYSEFGKYDVTITLPVNYIVASTGVLQNNDELEMLQKVGRQLPETQDNYKMFEKEFRTKARKEGKTFYEVMPNSTTQTKTLRYLQDNIHDFAWFASKLFLVQYDTLQLASKVIDVYSFFHPWEVDKWKKSVEFSKESTRKFSEWVAEYPYKTLAVVSGQESKNSGGMEYPTITLLTTAAGGQSLDVTLAHEIGHNWFYGILASNERLHPWMDEGMDTYYTHRYEMEKYGNTHNTPSRTSFSRNKTPDDALELLLNLMFKTRRDQPIATASEDFSSLNYQAIIYLKASRWMKQLEDQLGRQAFDKAIRDYYQEWKFKHPYPEDFKRSIEQSTGQDIDELWRLLYVTGPLTDATKKSIKITGLFNFRNTERYQYISLLPGVGYNKYDGLMPGAVIHNYSLPSPNFRFAIVPLFGTNSKAFNGIGQASYHWYSSGSFNEIAFGVNAARFSTNEGIDSNAAPIFSHYKKIVPSLQVYLNNNSPGSTRQNWFDVRSFLIQEQRFRYYLKQTDGEFYPSKGEKNSRYINQLTYTTVDNRVLYPYNYQLQVQQGKEFYRGSATVNYFFNYGTSGGLKLRMTAIKFGYIGGKTPLKQASTFIYQPKLTSVRGNEDYTYSNAFIGRNEFEGFASQQIMERDGNLKIRTDIFQDLQGRSDEWIAAVNLSTSIPRKLLPIPVPIKLFADAGTNADGWRKNAAVSRFLYVAGLQISLFGDAINIYAPLIYSKEFSNSLKTVPEENKFINKISFSINTQNLSLKRLFPQLPL